MLFFVSHCTENDVEQAFSPRVVIAEEAGQILEAHILASIVSTTEVRQHRP